MTSREKRLEIIQKIQDLRQSQVIAYLTSDRTGAIGHIASDAIRPMYDHARNLGFGGVERLDLFLYSRGGTVDVPWPMITMLREYCKELNVLIPFRAHSATTMIALGADHIVMGKKGELGPIDPQLAIRDQGEKAVPNQMQMSVENVMAFIDFLKERAGISDQAALAKTVSILVEQLSPWTIGEVYRIASHTRMLARKMISAHNEQMEERKIDSIVETLAEKMYFHGHAIGRREANEIGLPVEYASEKLDHLMWTLFEEYEELMCLNDPIDPSTSIPDNADDCDIQAILAVIESSHLTNAVPCTIRLKKIRQAPPQLNLNWNINVPLPPSIDPQNLPEATRALLGQYLEQFKGQAGAVVQAELNKIAPVVKIEGRATGGQWVDVTAKGT